jgi:hypothetical protein
VALPLYTLENALAFSGAATGIETEKLGYFALSVIWRAAVHQWATPFGGKTTVLNLGAAEESIRKFLLGEAQFPTNVAILATVCTDPYSKVFYMPSQKREGNPWDLIRYAYSWRPLDGLYRFDPAHSAPNVLREIDGKTGIPT